MGRHGLRSSRQVSATYAGRMTAGTLLCASATHFSAEILTTSSNWYMSLKKMCMHSLTLHRLLYLPRTRRSVLMISIEGSRFKDESGRTLLLRGINLGGRSKIPFSRDDYVLDKSAL